MGNVNTKADKQ